jgi:acyl-CoA synthetase (NDP forming)
VAGQRAGSSHTAAAAASDVIVDALFEQAGVLRVDTMTQMLDGARVLTDLPRLTGPRVAVVGNSGGPGILAADAAVAAGLTVAPFGAALAERIRRHAPGAASSDNPIDLGAGMQPEVLEAVLSQTLQSSEVDAVLGIVTPTLVADSGELSAVFSRVASDKPVVLVLTGERDGSLPMAGGRSLPVFGFPEPAAQALGLAWRYARIRETAQATEPAETEPVGPGKAETGRLITRWLSEQPADDGWLDPDRTAVLLGQAGIRLCPQRLVSSPAEAVEAAEQWGYPVVLKAVGVLHKSDVGGVRLGIGDAEQLRLAYQQFGTLSPAGVLVQPMVSGDVEIIVGGLQDPVFGPVAMVGAGGVFADLVADRRFLLAPATVRAAGLAIAELRLARVLDGYRGRPPVSRQALAELVSRVATLVEQHPEIAEIDLNPVLGRGEDLIVVDAKLRLAAAGQRPDAAVRELKEPAALAGR